jgi:hypothetical protein
VSPSPGLQVRVLWKPKAQLGAHQFLPLNIRVPRPETLLLVPTKDHGTPQKRQFNKETENEGAQIMGCWYVVPADESIGRLLKFFVEAILAVAIHEDGTKASILSLSLLVSRRVLPLLTYDFLR